MDISESFRPEDLSKTDFFDFVSAPPEQEGNQATHNSSNVNNNNDQPLQGFDQVSNTLYYNSVFSTRLKWFCLNYDEYICIYIFFFG